MRVLAPLLAAFTLLLFGRRDRRRPRAGRRATPGPARLAAPAGAAPRLGSAIVERHRRQAGRHLAPAADLVDEIDVLVLAIRARDPEPHRHPPPEAEPALLRDGSRENK